MEELVTITVDGKKLQGQKGALLWEVCREHGIDIPIFCYHTKLGPVGACRTCLVEQIGNTKGPITACSTQIADGMEIRTRSATAQRAQRGIFEFLLANHPLDCPICDRGGECPLQDQTFAYGPGTSRYVEPKRHHVKPIVLGPTIALDRERCVLCWRCVRFCADVAEDTSIVLQDRGDHTVVGTAHDKPYVSNFSGNVVELCPVGALTSRKQRFNFRPWELQNHPSVCPHCPMGCNINISVRKNDEVIRFLSRDNPEVDNSWLCDRGRFDFEFINDPQRVTSPMVKREGSFVQVSWDEALTVIASRFAAIIEEEEQHRIAAIASARLTNEDLFAIKRFTRDVLGTPRLDHFPRSDVLGDPGASGDLAMLQSSTGAIADLFKAKTIVLLGADPSMRTPVLELRIREAVNKFGAQLLVVSTGDIALTPKAAARIPYEASQFAGVVREITSSLNGSKGDDTAQAVRELLTGGPIVVVYDDAFDGTEDTAGALAAVAEFVRATGAATLPMLDESNSMGARLLNIRPDDSTDPNVLVGARAALVLGADLAAAGERMEGLLRQLEFLVVLDYALTPTVALADVVLPVTTFAEKRGTLTNIEGRVQLLQESLPPPGIARTEWEVLVDLSQYFDRPLDYSFSDEIWRDISAEAPGFGGLQYGDIGPRGTRAGTLQPV